MAIENVYIVSACRTGVGSFNGQYSKISSVSLGTVVIKQCLERAKIPPNQIDEVIFGHVLTAGQLQNPARQAAVAAGLPYTCPAYTINMLCGSGLKTVFLAYQAIRSGDANTILCGGQENMSTSEHTVQVRNNVRIGPIDLKDSMLTDGLVDPFNNCHMGNTAEYLAKTYNVSREAQDQFACKSQAKAAKACVGNYFAREIVPVSQSRPPLQIVKDEFVRHDSTVEKLSQIPTAFERDPSKHPSVTAGNSSGINDGAAALIVCNETQVDTLKLTPYAKIVAFGQSGVDPIEMGLGPIAAVQQALKRAGWSKDDVDLYEINEAFAVQALLVIEKLGLDPEKVNVTGGAIALGHPVGASGARVLVTLLHNLQRLDLTKGVAALCVGGGMGIAIAVERDKKCH